MCRLLMWSKIIPSKESFIQLQKSNGGDGDGLLVPNEIRFKKAYQSKQIKPNGWWVYKIIPKKKKITKKIIRPWGWPEEEIIYIERPMAILYSSLPSWGFYHTRKASVGKISIDNCHPVIGNHYIVFQNGTEKKIFNRVGRHGIPIQTDTQAVLYLLESGLITIEQLYFVCSSNFFIIDKQTKKFWIISTREWGITEAPLCILKKAEDEFIIASEPISPIKKSHWQYFWGILKGEIKENSLVLKEKLIYKESKK